MQIFFIKKKSTSYHDADDPRNGEGMGGDWKRDTLQTPLISPLTPPHTMCVGGRGDRVRVPSAIGRGVGRYSTTLFFRPFLFFIL